MLLLKTKIKEIKNEIERDDRNDPVDVEDLFMGENSLNRKIDRCKRLGSLEDRHMSIILTSWQTTRQHFLIWEALVINYLEELKVSHIPSVEDNDEVW